MISNNKISIDHLLDLIDALPKEVKFDYVKPGSNKAVLVSVDRSGLSVAIKKTNDDGDTKSAGMTTATLNTIVDASFEKVPFSVDSIFNGSGSGRSTWEAILANTSEFYTCKVENQKHLIWIPDSPHAIGEVVLYTGEYFEKPNASEHVLELTVANYITQHDNESLTLKELARILKSDVDRAKPDSKTLAIHAFSILYAPHITNCSELARLAGIDSFSASISDGKKIGMSLRLFVDYKEAKYKGLPLQQIYYGAPGTGKSHTINEQTEGESVIRTTFHPDSDYSTFVGAYKPTMGLLPICDELGQPMKIGSTVLHKEQIIYEFVDQAFLQAYVKAWKYYAENPDNPTKQYLVIEEINRGNCAQIFGDLFQLLDRNDYGFSVYPINADKDMKKQLAKAFKKDGQTITIEGSEKINVYYKGRDVVSEVLNGNILLLPDNLYIWATMNTSDQSLFPIDSAFKRRWEWQYMPIGKGYDEHGEEIKWAIEGEKHTFDWWSFIEKMNAQIGEATQSEDKKLGFFFCKATNGEISAEKFVGKVIFYLWNDVFKNNGFEGPIFKDVDGTELSFGKFYKSDAKGNAIVQKDKVELFLNNLGVSIAGETEVEDEKLEAAITGGTIDRSKYAFNGSGKYGKSDLGRTIMEKFINEHPELTFDQIKQTFPDSMLNNIPGPGLIVKEDENLSSYSRYYVSGYTSSDGIKYHIYKQWTIGNVPNIIRFAESQNWSVEKL